MTPAHFAVIYTYRYIVLSVLGQSDTRVVNTKPVHDIGPEAVSPPSPFRASTTVESFCQAISVMLPAGWPSALLKQCKTETARKVGYTTLC